ncbi:MAG: hypothetical protein Q8922_02930 [Bacteroidota bacterium]|nr:hypothetical protein [Bacteroidota bacterium]MDP4232920.1 hypothetical protein [Bacteroidota bacterium]MDP4241964.1 hypothetical protein [Bacteroidota bacterium]MDP4286867.1 hypothetical protein [Bacteroidota bacterium]
MKAPRSLSLASVALCCAGFALSLTLCLTLSSCSVTPNGPVATGASHGSLASDNMCDYYYKKSAGWTYAFSNIENIYNSNGTITTLVGAPDTVRTLGYGGLAPNGDSLYRFAITYRVSAAYAGRNQIDMWYIANGKSSNGAFVDGNAQVMGMVNMLKKPRPVSTDTILAGVVGRVRTLADDFTNTSSYVWQTDTLFASSRNDSVFVWECFPGSTKLSQSRCVFTKDFLNNTNSNGTGANINWVYDLIWGQTSINVDNANVSLTVPAGTFASTAQLDIKTPDNSGGYNMPITETKWFSYGVGFAKEYDVWNVTTDGTNFTKEDFTRSLMTLTYHN